MERIETNREVNKGIKTIVTTWISDVIELIIAKMEFYAQNMKHYAQHCGTKHHIKYCIAQLKCLGFQFSTSRTRYVDIVSL